MNRRYEDKAIGRCFGWEEVQHRWWDVTTAWMGTEVWRCTVSESESGGHEVDDWLGQVETILPPELRSELHLGLTSSDLTETALSLTLREADGRVGELCADLTVALGKDNTDHGVAYTHGVPSVATPPDHRRKVWRGQLERIAGLKARAYGRLRGPSGAYSEWATYDRERDTLDRLGLYTYEHSITQVLPRHVWLDHLAYPLALIDLCADVANDLRLLVAMGKAEVRGGTTSSAMPHKSNPSRLERVVAARTQAHALAGAVRDSGPLWLERDLTHSLVDRCSIEDVYHLACLAVADATWGLQNVHVSGCGGAPRSYEATAQLQADGVARSAARAGW